MGRSHYIAQLTEEERLSAFSLFALLSNTYSLTRMPVLLKFTFLCLGVCVEVYPPLCGEKDQPVCLGTVREEAVLTTVTLTHILHPLPLSFLKYLSFFSPSFP